MSKEKRRNFSREFELLADQRAIAGEIGARSAIA